MLSLDGAWKKGFIELGVEANAEVLAQCQKTIADFDHAVHAQRR